MKFIDLTHSFSRKMPVFPGDAYPEWRQAATIEKNGYNVVQLRTGMHVGTHMDAPNHMVEGGRMLSDFPPEHLIGPACVVNAFEKSRVTLNELDQTALNRAAIVLVYTGWDRYFGQEIYYRDYPELDLEFASALVEAGIKIVGLDFPSPDREPYAVHKKLLGNEVLIVENLTGLEALLPYPDIEVMALPARYEADGAPVRVVASVGNGR
ncbi:MAG: cyclase family protein [Haliscomenobacter sp.]|nr:cyclase family protein [Haliscomenobacter sp.]MBP9078264.1 cyclase family protein [Haliscomenobacter sp.]MBP9872641.1 cyclase family protein [Haliscomenobacter sp.]